MRHILVNHARSHCAGKRGAGAVQVTLDDNLVSTQDQTADVLAVDGALELLAKFDPRQAEIPEIGQWHEHGYTKSFLQRDDTGTMATPQATVSCSNGKGCWRTHRLFGARV